MFLAKIQSFGFALDALIGTVYIARTGAMLLSRRAWWLKYERHELLKRTQVEQPDKNVWREIPARGDPNEYADFFATMKNDRGLRSLTALAPM